MGKTINEHLRPVTQPYDAGRVILMKDFDYQCPKYGLRIRIKAGFIFDGASIPRFLWSTTGSPFMPQNIGPGLVHDYLYRYASDWHRNAVSKKKADKVFRYALKLNKVSKYQRFKMYNAVKFGGSKAWKGHRKQDAKK